MQSNNTRDNMLIDKGELKQYSRTIFAAMSQMPMPTTDEGRSALKAANAKLDEAIKILNEFGEIGSEVERLYRDKK